MTSLALIRLTVNCVKTLQDMDICDVSTSLHTSLREGTDMFEFNITVTPRHSGDPCV